MDKAEREWNIAGEALEAKADEFICQCREAGAVFTREKEETPVLPSTMDHAF